MTTSVASTYGMSKSSVPVWTATTGAFARFAARSTCSSSSVGAPREHADQAAGVLGPAVDADGAGRRAARELLRELLRERAADHERPRVLRRDPQLAHEPPDRHRAQALRHQRARLRPRWPRAWIACRTPIAIRFATIDEPPTVTNGSGIPVTGAIPIVMPTLTKTWKRKRDHDPAGDDRAEGVARDRDHAQAAPDDEQVEAEQERRAEEAALLGERGEDEVGVVLGEVVEPRLRRALRRRGRRARRSRPP